VPKIQNDGCLKASKCARNSKQFLPESTEICQKNKIIVGRKHLNVVEKQNNVCQKALKRARITK
jgi:hypothetical protein